MKKFSIITGRLSLVLLGIVAPLIGLEGVAGVMGLAPPPIPNPTIWDFHPALGWWHIPHSGGIFYSDFNEFATDVQINALGLRDDPEITGYDLPNRFRLLVLADSFGEALQVPLAQTFPKRLQALLNDQGHPTQTLNAGVGSWGTDQEAIYYHLEGHKFKPDLTLLFFFTRNDVVNNYRPLEVARNGGSIQKNFYTLNAAGQLQPPPPFDPEHAYDNAPKPAKLPPAPWLTTADWLWLHSHLYRWLVPYLRDMPPVVQTLGPSGLLGGEGRVRATHPAIPIPFYVYHTPPNQDWQAAWHLTEAIIAELRAAVEADGGQFAVVIIPAREQVYPAEWEQTVARNIDMAALDWDLTLPNQQLHTLLTRQQIPFLDLLPTFTTATQQDQTKRLYFIHDGHWTAAGHALAAETIFEFINREGLGP